MRDSVKGARSQHPSLEEEMAVPQPRLFAPLRRRRRSFPGARNRIYAAAPGRQAGG